MQLLSLTSTGIAHQVRKIRACHLGQDAQEHDAKPHTKADRSIKQQLENVNDNAQRVEVHVLHSKSKIMV